MRKECDPVEMADEMSRISKLVKLLDSGKAQFGRLDATHTRLGRLKTFARFAHSRDVSGLRRADILFLGICYTDCKIEKVAFNDEEVMAYVDTQVKLVGAEGQLEAITNRLRGYLSECKSDECYCRSLETRIAESVEGGEFCTPIHDRRFQY